jgi:hypothetical protein
VSCTAYIPPPTDTPQECFGFDPNGEFEIVSDNYCLDGPFTVSSDIGIIQAVPDGFKMVNRLENADGYADEYTERARIKCDTYSCEIQIHNSVVGINGYWGYRQAVNVEPGCHLIKATGLGGVNDPPNAMNYQLLVYVNDELIGQTTFPMQDEFAEIFPVWISQGGDITYTVLVGVAFASPGHNSYVDLLGLGMLAVSDGHCE